MTGGKWFALVLVVALLGGAFWILKATGSFGWWGGGMVAAAILVSLTLPKATPPG